MASDYQPSNKRYKANAASFPVTVFGRVTQDPSLRSTGNDTSVTNVNVAVSRRYQANGEWKEEVSFISFSVWREAADRVAANVKKGDIVAVTFNPSSLKAETYEANGEHRASLKANALKVSRVAWAEGDNGADVESDAGDDEIPF